MTGYHAAEAYIYHCTGKAAKTHSGLRAEFARLAKDEPEIDRKLVTFLAKAYELKSVADYGMNSAAKITNKDAAGAIETASRFVDCIDRLVSRDGRQATGD